MCHHRPPVAPGCAGGADTGRISRPLSSGPDPCRAQSHRSNPAVAEPRHNCILSAQKKKSKHFSDQTGSGNLHIPWAVSPNWRGSLERQKGNSCSICIIIKRQFTGKTVMGRKWTQIHCHVKMLMALHLFWLQTILRSHVSHTLLSHSVSPTVLISFIPGNHQRRNLIYPVSGLCFRDPSELWLRRGFAGSS